MTNYQFDLKLWMNVTIRAEDVDQTRDTLRALLHKMDLSEDFIKGFNSTSQTQVVQMSLEPEDGDEPENAEPEIWEDP